ncbi:MAG TPA: hypothetical protein VF160_10925 [Candidatus Dormibacteraeota bacterium]
MSSSSSPAAAELAACPACGLLLPAYARFCARCGTPQPHPVGRPPLPGRLRYPVWLIALLAGGAALALLVASVYGGVAVSPASISGVPTNMDSGQLRLTALGIAAAAAAFFALQAVAVVGLVRGRAWARVPATLACVAWTLTCIGAPLALLGLNALWRPGNR